MTRIMGDAIGTQAGSIPRSVQMVAGYVTGLGDVPWSDAQWIMFPGIPHVTIDQGAGASPNYAADVIDIETGAFTVTHVHDWLMNATAPDPAIYVNQSNMNAAIVAAVGAAGWKGAIWLAFPGWTLGMPLPRLPKGCRYVAVQDVFAGAYDLSTVLDDTWPTGDPMNAIPGVWDYIASVQYQDNGDIVVTGVAGSKTAGEVPTLFNTYFTRATNTWSAPLAIGTLTLNP